jgi:hypothetical protein
MGPLPAADAMDVCVHHFDYSQYGMISIHFYIATAGGIIAMLLLATALMGLVFLSSGSGHDEAIEDPFEDEADRD